MEGNETIAADSKSCTTPRTWRRDLFELGGIYALILIVIWTPHPWQAVLWVIAALTISYIARLSFEGFTPMGLCTANLVRSLWAVAFAMALSLAAVIQVNRQFGGQPWKTPAFITVRVARLSGISGDIEWAPAPVKRSMRPRWIALPTSEAYQ